MKTILIFAFLFCLWTSNTVQGVTLAWDASIDTNVTSYILYWGTNSGSYQMQTNVGLNLSCMVSNRILAGQTWFFVVTARNDFYGLESDPSNEVSCTIPPLPLPPPSLRTLRLSARLESARELSGPWQSEAVIVTNLSAGEGTVFYRARLDLRN